MNLATSPNGVVDMCSPVRIELPPVPVLSPSHYAGHDEQDTDTPHSSHLTDVHVCGQLSTNSGQEAYVLAAARGKCPVNDR